MHRAASNVGTPPTGTPLSWTTARGYPALGFGPLPNSMPPLASDADVGAGPPFPCAMSHAAMNARVGSATAPSGNTEVAPSRAVGEEQRLQERISSLEDSLQQLEKESLER